MLWFHIPPAYAMTWWLYLETSSMEGKIFLDSILTLFLSLVFFLFEGFSKNSQDFISSLSSLTSTFRDRARSYQVLQKNFFKKSHFLSLSTTFKLCNMKLVFFPYLVAYWGFLTVLFVPLFEFCMFISSYFSNVFYSVPGKKKIIVSLPQKSLPKNFLKITLNTDCFIWYITFPFHHCSILKCGQYSCDG